MIKKPINTDMDMLGVSRIHDLPNALNHSEPATLGQLISSNSYLHIQNSPSAEWIVSHNLGRYPSVTVLDSAGSVVLGTVVNDSLNNCRIQFSVPFSGKASLT